jgi:hypothetical protein
MVEQSQEAPLAGLVVEKGSWQSMNSRILSNK